jgi:hypothetical protein
MTKFVEVEPVEIVTVKHKQYFSINILRVQIFEFVIISVEFYDENKVSIERTDLKLEGDDYTNWGNDDAYLVNYVATKYGMQLKAIVPSEAEVPPASEAPV